MFLIRGPVFQSFQSWDCSFKGTQGSISGTAGSFRIRRVTFGHSIFATIFHSPKWHPKAPKNHPKGSQSVPIEHHCRSFWSSRWKCENHCFVYTKPSFSRLEGVPRDPRSRQKSASKKYTETISKKHKKYRKLSKMGPQGEAKRRSTNRHFRQKVEFCAHRTAI